MEAKIVVTITPAGRGVLARAEAASLSALGSYGEDAIMALMQGVTAWVSGLRKMGVLQEVLDRRGVEWEGDVEGELRVIPVLSE